MAEKHRYLLMGMIVGAGIILLVAMANGTSTAQKDNALKDQVGAYQLATGNSFYVQNPTVFQGERGRSRRVQRSRGRMSAFPGVI